MVVPIMTPSESELFHKELPLSRVKSIVNPRGCTIFSANFITAILESNRKGKYFFKDESDHYSFLSVCDSGRIFFDPNGICPSEIRTIVEKNGIQYQDDMAQTSFLHCFFVAENLEKAGLQNLDNIDALYKASIFKPDLLVVKFFINFEKLPHEIAIRRRTAEALDLGRVEIPYL